MNAKLFFKRNASTILTCLGGIGVVATAVVAVKDTPKAMQIIEKAREEKGEDLTTVEKIKVAGPVYIPAIAIGVSTFACIFGANALSKCSQASLVSAYALLDNSYKEYKKKVEELYGEGADARVKGEIARDKYDETYVPREDEKQLFYDYFSERYFESTMEEVLKAEYELNRELHIKDYVCLNEFYDLLGLDRIRSGLDLGWSTIVSSRHWKKWIDFRHEKVEMEDGMECYILTMTEPIPNFDEYC